MAQWLFSCRHSRRQGILPARVLGRRRSHGGSYSGIVFWSDISIEEYPQNCYAGWAKAAHDLLRDGRSLARCSGDGNGGQHTLPDGINDLDAIPANNGHFVRFEVLLDKWARKVALLLRPLEICVVQPPFRRDFAKGAGSFFSRLFLPGVTVNSHDWKVPTSPKRGIFAACQSGVGQRFRRIGSLWIAQVASKQAWPSVGGFRHATGKSSESSCGETCFLFDR